MSPFLTDWPPGRGKKPTEFLTIFFTNFYIFQDVVSCVYVHIMSRNGLILDKKPRNFGVGRHPTKYRFTQAEIAKAAGRSLSTVRDAIWRGKLDPRDLGSVVDWVSARRVVALGVGIWTFLIFMGCWVETL